MNIYKGDIFYIEKPTQYQNTGSEQSAGRPAIIVSNDAGNYHSDVVEVVYLTTKEKTPLPTHVKVMCQVPSTALCEQIFTVSKERIGGFVRSCTDEEMAAIDDALLVSLGIEPKGNIVMENALKLTCEKLKKENDEAQSELEALKETLAIYKSENEELKRCDKAVFVNSSEDATRLEFERDFYKTQYEALLEKMMK